MPNLISQDLYDETISLIEGKKEPSLLLKELQQWYSERGVTLYNIYFKKDEFKNHNTYGKYDICILSSLHEGRSKKKIFKDSLIKFLEVCKSMGLYQNYEWANEYYPNPGISGYYFPKIWRNEVIRQAGESLCPDIEKQFAQYGIALASNSGLGGYTVFFRGDAIDEKYKAEIINYVKDNIIKFDKHHVITQTNNIVYFDKLSILEEVYHGNLYYYYK